MKKQLLFLVISCIVLILSSCNKNNIFTPNEPTQPTKPIEYGTIQCINNSKHPFSITIKGNTPMTFTLEGKTSVTKKVEVGYYTIHVKQQSGYLLYATENDYEGYVTKNNNYIVSFTDNL